MSIFGGLSNLFSVYDEEDDGVVERNDERDYKETRQAEPAVKTRAPRQDNVSRIYPEARCEILLTSPKNVDDTAAVINNIRADNVCVVNLEGVDKGISQRVADVLGGAAFSLGCSVERISHNIFIIAPNGVSISGKLKSEIKSESSIFPWVASR